MKKGFTIVESLVAITILTTAVLGAMAAVQTGISSYIFSKDQIIAFYIAQEGFEQIRNIRDENRLEKTHWLSDIAQNSSDPCYFGHSCIVDPVLTAVPTRCPSQGNCPILRQDSVTGLNGYNSAWTPTIFNREISLTSINAQEIAITVRVTWSKGTVVREFVARENLLNW